MDENKNDPEERDQLLGELDDEEPVDSEKLKWDEERTFPTHEPSFLIGGSPYGLIEVAAMVQGHSPTIRFFEGIPMMPPEIIENGYLFDIISDLQLQTKGRNTDLRLDLKTEMIERLAEIPIIDGKRIDIESGFTDFYRDLPKLASKYAKSIPVQYVEKFLGPSDVVFPFLTGTRKLGNIEHVLMDAHTTRLYETRFRLRYVLAKVTLDLLGMQRATPIIMYMYLKHTKPSVTENLSSTIEEILGIINENPYDTSKITSVIATNMIRVRGALSCIIEFAREHITPEMLIHPARVMVTHESDQSVVDKVLQMDVFKMRTSGVYRPTKGTVPLRGLAYGPATKSTPRIGLRIMKNTTDSTRRQIYTNPYDKLSTIGITTTRGQEDYIYPHEVAVFSRITGLQFVQDQNAKFLDIQFQHPSMLGWKRDKDALNQHSSRWRLGFSNTDGANHPYEEEFNNIAMFTTWNSVLQGNLYPTEYSRSKSLLSAHLATDPFETQDKLARRFIQAEELNMNEGE